MVEAPIMQIVILVAGYLMIGSAVAVVSAAALYDDPYDADPLTVLALVLFWPFVVVAIPVAYWLYGCILAAQQLKKVAKKKED